MDEKGLEETIEKNEKSEKLLDKLEKVNEILEDKKDVVYDIPVEIGHEVRCKISGYRGIVVVKVNNLYRVPQFSIQAKSKFGSMKESWLIDEIQLEVLSEKPVIEAVPVKPKFKLGASVEDTVTGFKGVITAREDHMNGCIRYRVVNKYNEKDEQSMMQAMFDEGCVKLIKSKKVEVNKPTPNQGCAVERYNS